jgi:hypothetical protein
MGLHGLLQGQLYLSFYTSQKTDVHSVLGLLLNVVVGIFPTSKTLKMEATCVSETSATSLATALCNNPNTELISLFSEVTSFN